MAPSHRSFWHLLSPSLTHLLLRDRPPIRRHQFTGPLLHMSTTPSTAPPVIPNGVTAPPPTDNPPLHGSPLDCHGDDGLEATPDVAPPLHPSTTFHQLPPHSDG